MSLSISRRSYQGTLTGNLHTFSNDSVVPSPLNPSPNQTSIISNVTARIFSVHPDPAPNNKVKKKKKKKRERFSPVGLKGSHPAKICNVKH